MEEETTTTPTCERHGNATPLSCVRCETPICWGCLVETDVGYMCERHGRAKGSRSAADARQKRLVLGAGGLAAVMVVAFLVTRVKDNSTGLAPRRPVVYEVLAGLPENPGFEAGVGAQGRPVGWIGGAPGYEVSLDTEIRHGGSASGRVRASGGTGNGGGVGALFTCIPADQVAGRSVRLTAYLRTEAAVGSATGLTLAVIGERPDGRPGLLNEVNMRRFPILGTTGWKAYSLQTAVARGAERICLSAQIGREGTLWADDVVLERTGGPPPRPGPARPLSDRP
ncbi:MAG: hypothetical protein ABIW46_09860 [Acidimicrobiales bacterium]